MPCAFFKCFFTAVLFLLGSAASSAAGDRVEPGEGSAGGKKTVWRTRILAEFSAADASQAVAVDDSFFYAVHNTRISKYDKRTGEFIARWTGSIDRGELIHLNSGVVMDGRLYAAHSNYPAWPMSGSIEIWDIRTLNHIATQFFAFDLGSLTPVSSEIPPGSPTPQKSMTSVGSLTWVDRHGGFWWAGFANYDKVQPGQDRPYGCTDSTRIVRMDDRFNVLQSWFLPKTLLDRFRPMSNSGASWGPDNRLYLSGHDASELYIVDLPSSKSRLEWVGTVSIPPVEGQGIAWDRGETEPILWGIVKRERKVFKMRIAIPDNPRNRSRIFRDEE